MPTNRRSAASSLHRRVQSVESMESRRLLAVALANGVIHVIGDVTPDTYVVDGTVSGSILVSENGNTPLTFDRSLVTSINGLLGGGDDSFTIVGVVDVPISIDGEFGNDTIEGGAAADTLRGGDGNDSLTGGGDDDSLVGGVGDDTLLGGTGDDTILPGLGNDSIDGGNQADVLSYADRSSGIQGTLNVTIARTDPPDLEVFITGKGTINGILEADNFEGIRFVNGGSGNDTLRVFGTDNDNSFEEGLWNNYTGTRPTFGVSGGDGADTMSTGVSLDGFQAALFTVPMFANGDGGNDTLSSRLQNASTLNGGDGDDSFTAGDDDAAMPAIVGGAGVDSFEYDARAPIVPVESYVMPDDLENLTVTGANTFTVTGNDSANDILVTGQVITILGGGGDDTIRARPSTSAFIRGNGGHDSIRIHDDRDIEVVGNDRNDIDGGDGDDHIVINGGTDTVRGGDGDDSIYAGVGNDRVYGDAGNDRLNGDGGKDSLYGGDGDDRLYGNSGADRLFGELGIDRLYGGNKNDYLDGGAGGDFLKGDEDIDTAKRDRKDRRVELVEVFV